MNIKTIKDIAKKLGKVTSEDEVKSLISELETLTGGQVVAETQQTYTILLDFDQICSDIGRYDLDYQMIESHDCDHYYSPDDYNPCKDDYCRCGRITDVYAISFQLSKLNLPDEATDIQQLLTMKYANRVFSSCLDSSSDFEWNAVGGYYGEELDYVRPVFDSYGWNKVRNMFDAWNKAKSDNERVEMFLTQEYGSVIIPGADYQVESILLRDIDATAALAGTPPVNDRHVRHLIHYKENLEGWIVLKQSDNKYKLIDGRHRYLALQEKPTKRKKAVVSTVHVKCIVMVPT